MTATMPDHPLADRWVRMGRDGGQAPHVGVLTRVRPCPGPEGTTWWFWVLRTPTGPVIGASSLANTAPITHTDRALIARARRGLTRRRTWLENTIDPQDRTVPPAVARALADVDHDRALLPATPNTKEPPCPTAATPPRS